MKIKVLHVLQSLMPGGLENGVVNLVNHMNKDRFDVHLFCLRSLGEFQSRIRNKSTKVILRKPPGSLLQVAFEIRKCCTDLNIGIAHTHGWATLLVGFAGAKMAGVPVVINGEHGTIYDVEFRRRMAQRILFNWVDLNVPVSRSLGTTICESFGVNASKFSPILNGVDTTRFYPDTEGGFGIRDLFGIGRDAFVVGSVGRLIPLKNFQLLIKAAAVLKQRFPAANMKIMIIGEGEERVAIERAADQLGMLPDLLLPGLRDDVKDCLNAMDVFVLPSDSEGLSNVIMEAMACGKPVIASDVGGNSELVTHGETGVLFGLGDPARLAEALSGFLLDPCLRKSYGANALSFVERELSLSKMICNYEELYHKVLKSKC